MKLLEDLRALAASPRELWIVYVMKLLESIAYFTVYTLLVIFLSDDHGYSDTDAGTVAGTWLTAISLVVFVSGFVADAMGIRRALLVAAISTAIGRGLLAFSGSEVGIYTALVLSVWGIASMKPTMNAAVRAYTTPATVSFAFSFYYVVMNLGSLSQGPLITEFREWFKTGQDIAGVHLSSSQMVFFVGFVCSVLNVGLAAMLRDAEAPAAAQRSPLAIAREVMGARSFWLFMGFVGLLTMVRLIFQHAHLTWPKYSLRAFGDDFPFAWYWSINPAVIILLTPVVTALTRHMRPYPVIVLGAIVSSLSVFAMAFSTTITASVVFIVTLSLGEALWSPRLYEYTATIAPRGRESSYMGLAEVPLFLAKPVVGFFSGWALTRWMPEEGARNPEQMWWIIGLMTIAAPLAMVFLRSKIEAPATEPAAR